MFAADIDLANVLRQRDIATDGGKLAGFKEDRSVVDDRADDGMDRSADERDRLLLRRAGDGVVRRYGRCAGGNNG